VSIGLRALVEHDLFVGRADESVQVVISVDVKQRESESITKVLRKGMR
jgi:hypothetical protein